MSKFFVRVTQLTLVGIILFNSPTWATPKITVDTANIKLGYIFQKNLKDLSHKYVITNTGNKPLVINRVKPS